MHCHKVQGMTEAFTDMLYSHAKRAVQFTKKLRTRDLSIHSELKYTFPSTFRTVSCNLNCFGRVGYISTSSPFPALLFHRPMCELAEKYNALVFLYECYATGFLGKTGRYDICILVMSSQMQHATHVHANYIDDDIIEDDFMTHH